MIVPMQSINPLADRGPVARLALFGVAVAAAAAGAAVLGIAVGDRVAPSGSSAGGSNMHGGEPGTAPGMAVVSHGEYVALFGTTTFPTGRSERLTVRILGGDGQP